ncbi:MAG: peroxiredoxin-like family protein [Pseudomonadota bacterium]
MSEDTRVSAGSSVRSRVLKDVADRSVPIPQEGVLVHLQFRRFAGCPVCNLHLRSFARRHRELQAAGISEVVLFHSPADVLRPHTADFPFAIVADPDKRLYAEFGVTASPRALLDPRAWFPILRAVAFAFVGLLTGTARMPAAKPHGGRLGLPADFLIAGNGRVIACKYGEHVDDHWSVDEVLALARDEGIQRAATANMAD